MCVLPRHEPQVGEHERTRTLKIALLALLIPLTGCLNVKLENSQRLMDRPDFEAAAIAAPDWVKDALKTINELEERIEAQ
jgi:hypothetical protein